MINELMPRKKRYGFYPPVEFVRALCAAEYHKVLTRRDVRTVLDSYYAGEAK